MRWALALKEDPDVIEWQDSLSIGVLEIDIQHKLLFQKFNDFLLACQSQADSDTVHRLFWFLEAYTMTHFGEEEKLMQRVGYPELARHHKLHQEFIGEVARIKERLKTEGATPSLVQSLTRFMTSWLTNHISTMDRAIGRFVNSKA